MKTPFGKTNAMTLTLLLLFASAATAASITGKVIDETTSTALSRVDVDLYKFHPDDWGGYWSWYDWYPIYSGGSGKFSFEGLGAGTYALRAKPWEHSGYSIVKTYYPEFYDNIPGGVQPGAATPIVLAEEETRNLTMGLQSTPVSIAMTVEYPVAAAPGNVDMVRLLVKVKVKNWTNEALNLKRWGALDYQAQSGIWARIPQFPAKAFTLNPKQQKIFTHTLDIPASYTTGYIYFDVGPDPGAPWELYSNCWSSFAPPSPPVAKPRH